MSPNRRSRIARRLHWPSGRGMKRVLAITRWVIAKNTKGQTRLPAFGGPPSAVQAPLSVKGIASVPGFSLLPGRRIGMMRRLALLLFLCPAMAHGMSSEGLLGPLDATAVTGNGGLTATVESSGRVTGLRWPSPGYYDQLTYDAASEDLSQGLLWGLEVDGKAQWLARAPWDSEQRYTQAGVPVIETFSTLPGTPLQTTQTLFVHPTLDVLVARVAVHGAAKPPNLYWYANITPCTRLIPEVPLADWALDATNDFAVFSPDEGKHVYHFRPDKAHSLHWDTARTLASDDLSTAAWADAFRDGVWLAYTASETVSGFQAGLAGTDSSAFRQADAGALASEGAAVGQCDSAVRIQGRKEGDAYVATIFLAAGDEQSAAAKALEQAASKGYAALRQETMDFWTKRLEKAPLPTAAPAHLQALAKQCLMTILLAQDRQSGGMVRAPIAQPPLALDWPRHGAWLTYALDQADFHAQAEQHTLFCTTVVRTSDAPGKPTGSMPSACYTDGQDALPHLIIDTDAAAWTLWSFWQHAASLPDNKRAEYLKKVWDQADLMGTFLASWADGRTGQPLHSFDTRVLRDTQRPELLLTAALGVGNALQIAGALGHERSDWQARKTELDNQIRACCLDEQKGWKLQQPIPYWPNEVVPATHPSWDAIATGELARLERLSPLEAVRTLCGIAKLWERQADKAATLRPRVEPALRRLLYSAETVSGKENARSPIVPDALRAALAYIALNAVFSAAS